MGNLDDLDAYLKEDNEERHAARQSIQTAMTVLDKTCPLSPKAGAVADLIFRHMNLMTRALTNPPRTATEQRTFVNEVQTLRQLINDKVG